MPQESYRRRFGAELPLYPEAPVPRRLQLSDQPILERLAALRQLGDPRQIVSHWALLCARLLGLGWVGPAFGPEGLSLPAGIQSLYPLRRIEQDADHRQARAALEATLESLAEGVAMFLGSNPETALQAVRAEVHFHCLEQIQQGHLLPPPLAQAVLLRPAFDRIVDELRC
ncbi:MAG: hypothetical protein KF760_26800 [Candidatus Eremiobacteraeota bacterium]|nr:hypothetical protein [Candidatus Eremiobacteraeota bacterium]MCW5868844.1 hypothetical protein [Candidatus Eremiobacteraeota bacterium]